MHCLLCMGRKPLQRTGGVLVRLHRVLVGVKLQLRPVAGLNGGQHHLGREQEEGEQGSEGSKGPAQHGGLVRHKPDVACPPAGSARVQGMPPASHTVCWPTPPHELQNKPPPHPQVVLVGDGARPAVQTHEKSPCKQPCLPTCR